MIRNKAVKRSQELTGAKDDRAAPVQGVYHDYLEPGVLLIPNQEKEKQGDRIRTKKGGRYLSLRNP